MEQPDAQKLTHSVVRYGLGMGGDRCRTCRHFIGIVDPPRCEIIQSPVHQEDWCKRFQKGTA